MREQEPLDMPEDAPPLPGAEDREVLRERVAEALGHEPSEEEIAAWVRSQGIE